MDTSASSRPLKLKRALGPAVATAVVVGNTIGSGIFLKPGNIAGDCGQFGLILTVWVAGGLLCLLGALCVAELATMLPQAGGLYVYLREAYGKPVAFLFGWCEMLFSRPASTGALAVAFIGSLTLALQWDVSLGTQVLLAVGLLAVLAWVNCLGVVWGGRVQFATTLVKVAFLGLVALLPWLLLPVSDRGLAWSNYATTVTPRLSSFSMQISAVLLAVLWAYDGWHGLAPLAEEVRKPQRNIPLALFAGVGILVLLYVGANVAYHGVLSMPEMKAAGNHAAEEMLRRLLGHVGMASMSVVIMCSTFGALNSNLLYAPRVTFAMGRDGVFFRELGRVHAAYRTPVVAIVVHAAMAAGLVAAVSWGRHLVRDLAVGEATGEFTRRIVASLQGGTTFDVLTNCVVFSASIFYLLSVLAVVVLRVRRPEARRRYRTWGYPVTPLLFVAVYLWFLTQIYASHPLESRAGLLCIALGVPVYWLYARLSRRPA
ncbi:MAG: amino acid permease [Candidatus Anammoximicrobium sp.]|nr:amino acid permease [Candidatus Anammoximicrobium sp.]